MSTADDAAATAVYLEGKAAYDAGEYYKAGGKFEDSELLADSPAIKANSVLARIASYRHIIRRPDAHCAFITFAERGGPNNC